MSLVATLIANPSNPVLNQSIAAQCAHALGANDQGGSIRWLAEKIACDIVPDASYTGQDIHARLKRIVADLPVDIVVQNAAGRKKRLLIADMDSTMIQQECIDELAAEAGVYEQVASITARAMNGEVEFEPAMRERVALLKGLDTSIIKTVIDRRITLMPGGGELIATMRANGGYCALVSGGFTDFTSRIAHRLGFDENRANQLHHCDGKLAGTVAEPILGRQAKVDALNELAGKLNVSVEDAMAVGDGANDLGMLTLAGSGVALHAKPIVAQQAKIRIDHSDLSALLYVQGYTGTEIESAP